MNLIIEGRADGEAAALEDMGVDHGGTHVFVAEQFLDGANVVAGFEQMSGKGIPKAFGIFDVA